MAKKGGSTTGFGPSEARVNRNASMITETIFSSIFDTQFAQAQLRLLNPLNKDELSMLVKKLYPS